MGNIIIYAILFLLVDATILYVANDSVSSDYSRMGELKACLVGVRKGKPVKSYCVHDDTDCRERLKKLGATEEEVAEVISKCS